jgi:proton-dependent oligopeptide transporter, POT family
MATAAEPAVTETAPNDPGTEKGHPLGLYGLFGTEAWERFSYYGMRALLVNYMVLYHGWQPAQASSVYKWYTSLVYLTPLFGGLLADRYLGLRNSILVGGVLMAVGHFLMAFEQLPIFYSALFFLILGNGFFKPNISTLVGKMYKEGDKRRDGAFTIFYMGINLGAFVSPIACGYLREHYGFHHAFTLAGIGMMVGLTIFLVTQGSVIRAVEAAGNKLKSGKSKEAEEHAPDPNESKPWAEGGAGLVRTLFPPMLIIVGIGIAAYYAHGVMKGEEKPTSLIMPIAFVGVFIWMNLTLAGIKGVARDRSVVIFITFFFQVIFWMAFEQAGNALNLWAASNTDLHVFGYKYPAEWWQAVNAVLIVMLAPLFAAGWVWLGKRGWEPRTPTKVSIALGFVALSFVPMVLGAQAEDKFVNTQELAALPEGIVFDQKVHAGRLTFDPAQKALTVRGVLPRYVTNDLLIERTEAAAKKGAEEAQKNAAAAPDVAKAKLEQKEKLEKFYKAIDNLESATRKAKKDAPVKLVIPELPATWVFPFSKEESNEMGVAWDDGKKELSFFTYANTPIRRELKAAGADPALRDSLWALEKKSNVARVSGIWLLLSYFFATLGELCCSPVGLSLTTKLAPIKYASLFMGVFLLSSSLAQYAGGLIGESWGIIAPTKFFMIFVISSAAGMALQMLIAPSMKRLMHGVH